VRVLHVIAEMGAGGAESLVVQLTRDGRAMGWDSAVASAGGRRADELRADGVRLYAVPLTHRRSLGVVRAARAARRAVSTERPDAILAHNVGSTVVAGLAARSLRHRPPVVAVFHGVSAADYPSATRLLDRFPDHVVPVSQAVADRLRTAGLRGRMTVIPNAVTPPELPPADRARRELDLPDGTPVALCLARLVPQKRHDVLLRAWAGVPAPAQLLVAGNGPLRSELEQLTAALGLTDRVRFLGQRSDIGRLLAAADVTTLASDWEGLPIAVLESLGAGRPVVATAVDGVAGAVGRAGRLVPPGDPAALAAGLTELLYHAEARIGAAEAARDLMRTHYDPAVMMASYARLLASVVRASSAHGRGRRR
jgi:glycosyltransferase involved in cell wall biosynthesis